MSTYTDLIAKLATDRPWGYRHSGDVTLTPDQLGAVIADTDDEDTMEEVLKDQHLRSELSDQLNASTKPADMAELVGAILMHYVDGYAKSRVYNDVRCEIWRREEEEEEDEARENYGSAASISRAIDDLDRTAPL
jgi:hypothetical protein